MDAGVRCEAHVGEVFPPRCADCEALAVEVAPAPAVIESWAESHDPPDGWGP